MSAFILTWKEAEWDYSNVRALVDRFVAEGSVECLWRVAAHKQAERGAKAFLLKQLPNPRGIFAAGTILDAPQERDDPSDKSKSRWRSRVRWDVMVDPGTGSFLVLLSKLQGILPSTRINAHASGQGRLSVEEEEALSLEVGQSPFTPKPQELPLGPGSPSTGPKPTSWIGVVQRNAEEPAFTYALQFGTRTIWKVGFTTDTDDRLDEINRHVPFEITGERWELRLKQAWRTSVLAYEMEQTVLNLTKSGRTVGERVACDRAQLESAWQSAFLQMREASSPTTRHR